jgi:hypothetical protein
VTTAIATTTVAGVLTLYRYPAGVVSSKIALGTIALGNQVANVVAVCDIANPYVPATKVNGAITVRARNKADIDAGDVVAVVLTTDLAAASGAYSPFVCFNPRAETVDNQAKLIDLTP